MVHPLSEEQRRVAALAVLGFSITAAVWAYSAFGDYSSPMNAKRFAVVAASVVLCPPSVLTVPFWETEPDSGPGLVLWILIAMLNSLLYTLLGALITRHLRRKGPSLESDKD